MKRSSSSSSTSRGSPASARGSIEPSLRLVQERPSGHYSGAPGGGQPLGAPSRPEGTQVMSRRGFTLIELLIVVVIIGLLAAIAIPKFSNTKEKAYVAAMKSDLRNLATAEEAIFYDSAKYTTSFALMGNFLSSAGVGVGVKKAPPGGGGCPPHPPLRPGAARAPVFSWRAARGPAASGGRHPPPPSP